MNCKLSVVALTLAVTVSGVWAQASAEKKVLSARILQAQKPNIEAMARTLAEEPAANLLEAANAAVPQRIPEARELMLINGVLRIVRNHLALLDYGERDTLTGLLNRKTFEAQFEKLRRELAAATSAIARDCWIGVLDIDHFKAVNDGYGHVIGARGAGRGGR